MIGKTLATQAGILLGAVAGQRQADNDLVRLPAGQQVLDFGKPPIALHGQQDFQGPGLPGQGIANSNANFFSTVIEGQQGRSEERRVGKEWVSTGRSRWSP